MLWLGLIESEPFLHVPTSPPLKKWNNVPDPLSRQEKVLERTRFREQVTHHLQCRMPPDRDAAPYVEKAMRKYRPPNRAVDRKRVFKGALVASRRLIVPEWSKVYLDQKEREAARRYLLGRFQGPYPLAHAVLVSASLDEQWVFLMRRFQGFDGESTARIMRLHLRKVDRLYRKMDALVGSKLRPSGEAAGSAE